MSDPGATGESGREPSARGRILEAALGLFGERGFEETSVSEVARAADVSKGLVYHYFETKRHVLRAVVSRGAGRLESVLAPDSPAPTSALVMEALALVAEDLPWWRLYFRLRMQPDVFRELGLPPGGAMLQRAFARSLRDEGRPAGDARAGALSAAVEGAAQRYVLDPDGYPLVEVAEAIVEAHLRPARRPGGRSADGPVARGGPGEPTGAPPGG